jgi:hypothetical protein
VLDTPQALASPDRGAAVALRQAFACIRQMAAECQSGNHAQARLELERCQGYLGRAAAELAPYGLRP